MSAMAAGAWVVAAVAVCAVAGCGHGAATPVEAVRGFGASVARGDLAGAYTRMSAGYRRRVPEDQFRAALAAEPELRRDAAQLATLPATGGATRATLETEAGERFALVLEDGAWRLDQPPVAPFDQSTPRAALRTFLRAIEHRRWDVLARLVPSRHRGAISEAALRAYYEPPDEASAETRRKWLDLLRAAAADPAGPILEEGDSARLRFSSDHEIRFMREDGLWKVDDAT